MLETAFGWIGQIAEWVGQFIPRWFILDTTEAAIKWRAHVPRPWGTPPMDVIALGPGLHAWWPVTTKIQPYPSARQTDELRGQTIVTTDDKTIIVAGCIVYEVVDIGQLLPRVFRAQQAITDIALTAVHDVCCRLSWDDLKSEQRRGTLDTKLKNQAQRDLKEYGVQVIKVMLIDLSPCRVLKLVQTTAKGED